jgi:hypothetical protein
MMMTAKALFPTTTPPLLLPPEDASGPCGKTTGSERVSLVLAAYEIMKTDYRLFR